MLLFVFIAGTTVADRAQAQLSAASLTNAEFVSETGQAVRLSDYRGKVVFLNFWGNWCAPCAMEMSSIRGLQAALGNRNDVAFIFVSARPSEIQPDSAWLRSRGIAGQSVRMAGATPRMPVPTTFVIDGNGNVAQYRNSAVDWVTHIDFIRALLQHRTV